MQSKVKMMMAAIIGLAAMPVVNGRQMTYSQQQQGVVEDLEAQVTNVEGVNASASTLIGEMAKYIAAHANDPAALQAFASRLQASADALAAAVAANPDPDPAD